LGKPSAPTPAHLTALAPGVSRLVGGPLVRSSLLVSGAATLAGDLALLFPRHRRETSSFFPLSNIHRCASVRDARTTYGPF
jgi:hypothetical protein